MRASSSRRRPGNMVVAVAISLVTLLSCVALAVDGGMMHDRRRQVQAAADAAALTAASELYVHWALEKGSDSGGYARTAAVDTAQLNGYVDGESGNKVEVYIPPQTGPFTGAKGYAEVVITYSHARYFSKIFGTQPIPVRARAVARGRKSTTGNAILCLDPTVKGAYQAGGGGGVTVSGATIQVNSNNSNAAIVNGGGTTYVSEMDITGTGPGYVTPGGGSIAGPITTGTDPIPDPLAYLPPPDPSTMPLRSTKKVQYSGGSHTLDPGVYVGGISVGGQASLFLNPGIYYMMGGGFNFSGQGSLVGYKVMIYNDPQSNSDVISLSGNNAVKVVLTPPDSGPYQGILFWQKRGTTPPISITGNGNLNLKGTFYATGADMTVAGNGAGDFIGSQYIVNTLKTTGTGSFSVSWTPTDTPGIREVALVE